MFLKAEYSSALSTVDAEFTSGHNCRRIRHRGSLALWEVLGQEVGTSHLLTQHESAGGRQANIRRGLYNYDHDFAAGCCDSCCRILLTCLQVRQYYVI